MDKCIGIISESNNNDNFGGLCVHRPSYMLPFGGRYRLIDFAISNMVNHGIKTIALFTGQNIRSTMDHIGNGNPWDLNRRFNGLFLFPPSLDKNMRMIEGNIQQFHSAQDFFIQSREKNILIYNPNFISKIRLSEAFKKFVDTDADMTLVYKRQRDPEGDFIYRDKMHLDKEGNLLKMGINLGTESEFNLFMETGFIKKEVFLDLLQSSLERGDVRDFRDAILNNIDKYKVNSYEFKGHVENISDIKNFYEANMNLLKKDISRELFFKDGLIYTKSKDEPSTWYKNGANVKNSLIANGCIIEGEVTNSIIHRGVTIGKNAIVKNSIVMQKSDIFEDAIVVNSILDKYACIEKGARLAGSLSMPYIVEKYQKIRKD